MAAAGDIATMSLCIPRVFPNIGWKRVKGVFEDMVKWGIVDRVDMVKRVNDDGKEFKRVFVHFKSWNDTDEVREIQAGLENGEEAIVHYEEKWFWKVRKSNVPRPERDTSFTKVQRKHPKKAIDLSEKKVTMVKKDVKRGPGGDGGASASKETYAGAASKKSESKMVTELKKRLAKKNKENAELKKKVIELANAVDTLRDETTEVRAAVKTPVAVYAKPATPASPESPVIRCVSLPAETREEEE